MSTALLNI